MVLQVCVRFTHGLRGSPWRRPPTGWISILYITLYFFCHILTHAVSCVKMWLYDSDIAENFERYKGGECDAVFKNSDNRHAARAV